MTKKPLLFIVSLGCAKNWLDTEVMAGSAITGNILLTETPDNADIYMINTCSFIFDARTESDDQILEALAWKKERPGRRVVVAGCLPQRNLDEVKRMYAEVDLFLGLNDVPNFAALVDDMFAGKEHTPDTEECTYIYDENTPRLQLTPNNFAYVKIAEGCNHMCSFCAIPSIRGKQRSRSQASIVKEVENLLDNGVSEIILIAQDTTSYGRDLQEESNLGTLLRELNELEGDFWIRVLYTHPLHFTDEVIAAFRDCNKVVPYIDMPLQHIADPLLKSMKRGVTEAKTKELVRKIRAEIPGAVLRTAFIVGYPGETEADYQNLKAFIEEVKFERMGVFSYSPEEGTPAAEFPNQVDEALKAARQEELMQLQAEISLAHNESLVGETIEVVIEGMEDEQTILARSYGDAPEVDNLVHIKVTQDMEIAPIIEVTIDGAETYDLFATI